jgi:hypothetical protein
MHGVMCCQAAGNLWWEGRGADLVPRMIDDIHVRACRGDSQQSSCNVTSCARTCLLKLAVMNVQRIRGALLRCNSMRTGSGVTALRDHRCGLYTVQYRGALLSCSWKAIRKE